MLRYILRRIVTAIPVLFGLTIVVYGLITAAPGDPVGALVDPEIAIQLGPEWVAQQRESLGLNKPVPVRYALWLREIAQGNFGYSQIDRQSINEKIASRLWPTVKLMGTALLIGILVGVPLGIVAAVKQYSWLDYLSNILGLTMVSIPSFFVALAAIYLLGVKLQILPTSGMVSASGSSGLVDSIRHLILPATVLGLAEAAVLVRYARASMLEVLHQEYIVTARAKGLREQVILLRHALRNSLIPLITIIALQIPGLLGGSVIIEHMFAWPGLGSLAIGAIFARDYPVIMALNLIGAMAILFSSLFADVLYSVTDPRIRYQ